ncbi:hypothetical protein PoB_006617500 [Plakobranchus ocellatus]|uniref:Uncharacterized protein n=1 Tax=Plakobranchus ocellatus TaxID=259542 RepID=A0AAV4D6A5_9GAST|nr:hypothetical protein PoB_006617500 [Plakobranchus ocellatus]
MRTINGWTDGWMDESPGVLDNKLAPNSALSTSFLTITSVFIASVQCISFKPAMSSKFSCGSHYLQAGVDDIVIEVQVNSSDVPEDKAYKGAYFRQKSKGGTIKRLCSPNLNRCSATNSTDKCACVSETHGMYTIVFRYPSSVDLSNSVIDFVWEGRSRRLTTGEYRVPQVRHVCSRDSPDTLAVVTDFVFGISVVVNGILSLFALISLFCAYRHNVCECRRCVRRCFCLASDSDSSISSDLTEEGAGGSTAKRKKKGSAGSGGTEFSMADDQISLSLSLTQSSRN